MATPATNKRKNQQRQAAIRLVIMMAILVCINILAARFHTSLDLTKEKRFTLSEATQKMLKGMDDVAVIDIYLKGKFPAGFQRLSEATRERLQSFKEYAGNRIVFHFIDPLEGKNERQKGEVFSELAAKGVMGVGIRQSTQDDYSEKMVFPYALVHYKGKERPVSLLENYQGVNASENLNKSEALLEYKFASAIHSMIIPDKPNIAYIVGNGEALGWNTSDALMTLSKLYHIDTIDLVSNVRIPVIYDAIIIDKPTLPFEDKEKFKIDQYVMRGGHVLWMVDMVHADMDSLHSSEQFIAMDQGLNLDDILFKYGVRVNPDLIEDIQCNPIPITVGMNGDKPKVDLRNWIYFPVLVPIVNHPIVNNMFAVMSMFANSIDTIGNPEIKKTVLLSSSKYSRTVAAPVRVNLNMLKYPPKPELFNKPYRPVAVLLEGKFRSVFTNRLPASFMQILQDSLKQPFKPECDSNTSMIVISDGDIMQNDLSQRTGPMEMGYWRYTNEKFANKDFVLNCVDYLTDRSGLLVARSKDLRLRLLDAGRVKVEKTKWQIINIGVPILLVLIFASGYMFFRKRRYETKA
ncbi:MAG: gliding motility-associated ABC transporter substrate-binding protein GldG [Bacteroidota bacterium]